MRVNGKLILKEGCVSNGADVSIELSPVNSQDIREGNEVWVRAKLWNIQKEGFWIMVSGHGAGVKSEDIIAHFSQSKPKLPQYISIDILADAYEGGTLITPFTLGKQEIQQLGIYEEKGIKFWVIKKNDRKKFKPEEKYCECKEPKPYWIKAKNESRICENCHKEIKPSSVECKHEWMDYPMHPSKFCRKCGVNR